MSQSFGGRGFDEIPLETLEERCFKYNTYSIRKTSPSFQHSVLLSKEHVWGVLQEGLLLVICF